MEEFILLFVIIVFFGFIILVKKLLECKKQKDKIVKTYNTKLYEANTKYNALQENYGIKIEEIQQENNKKILKLKRKIEKQGDIISKVKKELWNSKQIIIKKDKLFEQMKNSNNESLEYISSLVADHLTLQYSISAEYLENKKHPANLEALRIKRLRDITKEILKSFRIFQYKYEYLLQLFPDLELYVDDFETMDELRNLNSLNELANRIDKTRYYLSKEEYKNLSEIDRNQLALDRYIESPKSKWQIGRDYELFIGYEYTKNGWKVDYFGIDKQLKDMGRDLIATKENVIHVIQCKYWSKEKLIHEKHIAQLYGTTVQFILSTGTNKKVVPVFVTNISLSKIAKSFAEYLKVKIIENKEIGEFPRIKCNINYDENGQETKIYHLPMDQQYDRTKIYKKGEFFAFTVKEAVEAGFRRAWRWYGNG